MEVRQHDTAGFVTSSFAKIDSAAPTGSVPPSTPQSFKLNTTSFDLGALDRFMAIPWMLNRAGAGAFSLFGLPERIDGMLGSFYGGTIIAAATGNRTLNLSSTAVTGLGTIQGTTTPVQEGAAGSTRSFLSYASLQHARSFGGVFTYLTSKWAFACLTLVSA